MNPNQHIIQRIKLLMEYDMSKTLEENVNGQSNWDLYPCVTKKPNYKKIETSNGIHYLSKGDWLWNYSPNGTFTAKDNSGKIVKSGGFYCNGDTIVTTTTPMNKIIPTGNLTTAIDTTMTSGNVTGGVQNYSATGPGTMGFSPAENVKFNWHDALPLMSFASYIIPVIGPFLALGFDLIDVGIYASEGDYFNAGLYLALSIIPGDDILKIVSKRYNVSRSSIKSLLKKLINKVSKFTEEEIKIMKGIAEEGDEVAKLLRKNLQTWLGKRIFKSFTLKRFVTYIWLLLQNNPVKYTVFKYLVLKVGGITYTYGQLAEIYGLKKIENKPKPKVDIKKLETDFQSNKDTIISEAVEDLLPYTEEEQLINYEIYLDSAYAK